MNSVPALPNQWKADAMQAMAGTVPGVQTGITEYVEYYDYPTRHRYSYVD